MSDPPLGWLPESATDYIPITMISYLNIRTKN